MVNADREAMGADLLTAMKAMGLGAWMELTEEDGYRSVWVETYSTMDLRDLADELIRLGWTKQ